MEHDASDILGQNTMPTAGAVRTGLFSLSLGQTIFAGIALVGFYVCGLRLWRRLLLWRERSYKLATRRRHGIPDTDLRPFNVAYAEAAQRAREEENQRHPKPRPAPRPQPSIVDLRETSQEQVLRNRSGIPQRPDTGTRSTAIPVPGGYRTSSDSHLPASSRHDHDIDRAQSYPDVRGLETNGQFTHPPSQSSKTALTRQRGYLNVKEADASSHDSEDRKRPLDEEMDEEHESKKSRVDEDAVMDSDMNSEYDESPPKRGSKRGLREEDLDEFASSKKARGKRPRNGLPENATGPDSSMDVDFEDEEADEVAELPSGARGKKRDRTEAGSTFGGDDDESAAELEDGDAKSRRRRKRRTVAKRKSEASYLRGKKRDREGSPEDSEGTPTSSPDRVAARAKRGKRSSYGGHRDQDAKSDVSMGESTTSNKSKVRNVGDEWESNGVRYKIGPNYQRLRQALVKKARQKFLMPKDSQHPDREEHLQVCIETWLTEEQYQEAKNQHMLAWQDDSPARPEHTDKLSIDVSHANGNVPGKSLLWGSSAATTPTMSPAPPSPTSETGTADSTKPAPKYRNHARHSIAASVAIPVTPFQTSHIPTAKRIASTSHALNLAASISGSPLSTSSGAAASPATGLADSTNVTGSPRTPLKVFSKWEKQELEARAMMKIREATRKKEMEREAKLKEEREAHERAEKERERQRLERERVEREQKEARERAQKEAQEKAEAEKKAKEAAEAAQKASAVPQITITAPSTLGSQPSQSSAPAAAATSASGTTPAAGGFSFSPFGTTSTAKTEVPLPCNPFGAPVSSAQNGASTADGSKAEIKPAASFSFGNQAGGAGSFAAKEPQAAVNSGPSLFSRLGAPAPAASSEPAKPAAAPSFSFNVNKQDGAAKTSPFAAPASSAQPAAPSSDSTASTTPKFNFGFGAKTAANTTTPAAAATKSVFGAPTASSSSLSGALGSEAKNGASDASAAAPSPFGGFKTPAAPASATNGSAATTTPSAPKFSFVSSPSAFGTSSAFPSTNTTTAGHNTAPAKSVFGATSSGNTASAFEGSTGAGPSPFGATPAQTQSVFGGGAGTKPGESKPLFSFATPSASPAAPAAGATLAAAAGTGTKSAFAFETTSTPASAPKFSFNFGGGNSTTPAASPFGSAPSSGQSVFGSGVFGSNAQNQAGKQ